MSLEALSQAWFEHAMNGIADAMLPEDRSARIQFDAAGRRWGLVIEQGKVTRFELGEVDSADVELRWSLSNARSILTRDLSGNAAFMATTAIAQLADGTYTGTPAPLNLLSRPELKGMPKIPAASLLVAYHYHEAPFGELDYLLRFVDGQLVSEEMAFDPSADVRASGTYRAMALIRAGELTVLDALADGGELHGEMGPLATLAGIAESPEFNAAQRATGRHAVALSVLGELEARTNFVAALADVAAQSSWSELEASR